jgi:hypothetical protein
LLSDDNNDYIFGAELKRLSAVLEKFPSASHDIAEAGTCFAFGSFTACVYHLMRVCEYGLVSLAKTIGLEPRSASWDTILRKIQRTLELNSSTKPQSWKAEEAFYSEASALMGNVKNSWRNAVSHVPKIYDEPSARRIFNSVEALMLHLSTRLSETPLGTKTALQDPLAPSDEQTGLRIAKDAAS